MLARVRRDSRAQVSRRREQACGVLEWDEGADAFSLATHTVRTLSLDPAINDSRRYKKITL